MAHAASSTAAADIPGPPCFVCERLLEYRDKWPGEIKGRFICLRCADGGCVLARRLWRGRVAGARAVLGEFWDWTPLANPRSYHHRKADTSRCLIARSLS